jgi:hypothetical protein
MVGIAVLILALSCRQASPFQLDSGRGVAEALGSRDTAQSTTETLDDIAPDSAPAHQAEDLLGIN